MGADIITEFWCKYIRGNELERYELVERLYDKNLDKLIDEKYRVFVVSLLVSLFNDLIEVLTSGKCQNKNIASDKQ